jgi:hypothetical protein
MTGSMVVRLKCALAMDVSCMQVAEVSTKLKAAMKVLESEEGKLKVSSVWQLSDLCLKPDY